MWNVETTVDSTLHGTKDSSTGSRAHKTSVQVTSECSRSFVQFFDIIFVAGYLCCSSVQSV